MRPRDQILGNLESLYRESYAGAKAEGGTRRMEELDSAYQRDQLMMEVLLDLRDLMAARGQVTPPTGPTGALEHLKVLRRITKLR